MTTAEPTHETPGIAQLGRDTALVFRRALRLRLREPVWIVVGIMQPILYLALFAPLLERLVHTPGFPPGNAWQVFVPGLLLQLVLFGSAFAGFPLIDEIRSGVIERIRVTPVSRTSLLLGRILVDMLSILVQCAVLVGAGVAFGLRAPWLGVLASLAVAALAGGGLAALSYVAALKLRDEGSLAAVTNFFAVPLLLLSGILLPMALAPGWLDDLSHANPFRYAVDALRHLFRGSWASGSVAAGVACMAALAIVGVVAGALSFRAEQA